MYVKTYFDATYFGKTGGKDNNYQAGDYVHKW